MKNQSCFPCKMDIMCIPQNVESAKYEPLANYSIASLIPVVYSVGECNESTWDINRN